MIKDFEIEKQTWGLGRKLLYHRTFILVDSRQKNCVEVFQNINKHFFWTILGRFSKKDGKNVFLTIQ